MLLATAAADVNYTHLSFTVHFISIIVKDNILKNRLFKGMGDLSLNVLSANAPTERLSHTILCQ